MNKKINWLAFFVLFFPVIIDAINGYINLGGGKESSLLATFYKGAVLAYSFKYALQSSLSNIIKTLIGVYLCCAIYQYYNYGVNIADFIKIVYPYIVTGLCLTHYKLKDQRTIYNYSLAYGLTAAIIIIICSLTGYGYNPYGAFIGNRGLFRAGNDIGHAMILSNCIAVYMYLRTKKFFYFICFLSLSTACVLIATTAGIIGSMLVLLGLIISVFFNQHKDFRPGLTLKLSIIIIVVFVSTYAFSFLVDNIQSIDYLSMKFDNINSRFTDSSGRTELVKAARMAFQNYSFFDWVFGASNYYHYYIGDKLYGIRILASAEVDFYDLVGCYGMICTILVLLIPLKYVWFSIALYFKNRSLESFWLVWFNFIFISCAFYAGHAFTAITPFTLFMIVNTLKFRKK